MAWLRWIRGAVGIGATWAALWALMGALIWFVDRGGSMHALWLGPAIGVVPGFLAGLVFAAVLGITAGRRRLDELPLLQSATCGGLAGLLVGALPFAINQPPSEAPLWRVAVVVIGSMTLLGTLSAAGSLVLARKARGGRP